MSGEFEFKNKYINSLSNQLFICYNINIIVDIALLIPIHPPHYHFIYKLINKLKQNHIQIDIFLIFSNISDFNKFEMKNDIKYIIIKKPFTTESIVTFKKFFGLQQLINSKYDYFICCDAEIDIIPENFTNENIRNKIKNIFNNKKIYAGDTSKDLLLKITETSANLFPNELDQLKNITNNFNLYFWWSDIPVYRRTDLEDFFKKINYTKINWFHYDYLIYQYYLIITHNFTIINTTPITNINWSLETLNTSDINILNKLNEIQFGFGWMNKGMYNLNTDLLLSKGTFILYHLDRHASK
jgi:hypothetical protein